MVVAAGSRPFVAAPFDELGPFTDPEIRRIVRRDLGGEPDLRTGVRALARELRAQGSCRPEDLAEAPGD